MTENAKINYCDKAGRCTARWRNETSCFHSVCDNFGDCLWLGMDMMCTSADAKREMEEIAKHMDKIMQSAVDKHCDSNGLPRRKILKATK